MWNPVFFTLEWKMLSLIALLLITSCTPWSNDEAIQVLEDLASPYEHTRLKANTLTPVRHQIAFTEHGRNYHADVYNPAEPVLAAVVLVPGVVENGKDDFRVVAFATTLARARFLVLVPDLPNLRALKVQAQDAEGVTDAFTHLLTRSELANQMPAGIVAFSYAVGPAILAALNPTIKQRVDFVLGVGGYYDLTQVITFFTTGYFRQQGQWRYLEPNRHGKWVFVIGNVERLSEPLDRSLFLAIAKRKMANPYADIDDMTEMLSAEGQSLLALIQNHDPVFTPSLIANLPDSLHSELDALNLASKDLSQLQTKLILLHGTDDSIIPYTESVSLAAATPSGQSELFLIDGLAHVDIKPKALERFELWQAIKALLAQRKNAGADKK